MSIYYHSIYYAFHYFIHHGMSWYSHVAINGLGTTPSIPESMRKLDEYIFRMIEFESI